MILSMKLAWKYVFRKITGIRGAWLAQSVEQATLDLRVFSLSPAMRVEIT